MLGFPGLIQSSSKTNMFSIFHHPRRYPLVYAPYYDSFDFYHGRAQWEDSIKNIPAKAVHLFAVHWLHLEVYNGGFWQYFYNSTSISFPEAVDGFKAIGMSNVAKIIQEAATKVGTPFPFDKEVRELIVGPPEKKMNFETFDEKFYELADTDTFFRRKPKFVVFADAYADNA